MRRVLRQFPSSSKIRTKKQWRNILKSGLKSKFVMWCEENNENFFHRNGTFRTKKDTPRRMKKWCLVGKNQTFLNSSISAGISGSFCMYSIQRESLLSVDRLSFLFWCIWTAKTSFEINTFFMTALNLLETYKSKLQISFMIEFFFDSHRFLMNKYYTKAYPKSFEIPWAQIGLSFILSESAW